MDIIFATSNKGKLREASEILGAEFTLHTPSEFAIMEDIPETGETLAENSLQKAEYLFQRTALNCFADDTGLEVDALGGAPGVRTARYAGEGHDFTANMDKLLRELAAYPTPEQRRARFRSVVTLIIGGEIHRFEGTLEGHIAFSKAGCGGFGYDPIFIADEYPDRTLAEIAEDAKNAISHRGKALRAMAQWLKQQV